MIAAKINKQMALTSPWGATRTVAEWMKAQEINEVYEIYGHWCVSDYGLENLVTYYPISVGRLWQSYPWALHMSEKVWVNLPDFCAALEAARKFHGSSH